MEYVVHASGPQLKIMLVTAVFEYKTVGFRNSELCSETRLLCSQIRPLYSKKMENCIRKLKSCIRKQSRDKPCTNPKETQTKPYTIPKQTLKEP